MSSLRSSRNLNVLMDSNNLIDIIIIIILNGIIPNVYHYWYFLSQSIRYYNLITKNNGCDQGVYRISKYCMSLYNYIIIQSMYFVYVYC